MNKKNIFVGFFSCLITLIMLNSVSVCSESISSNLFSPLNSGLYQVTPPIINYFKYGEFFSSIELIRDWRGKSFTNTTFMFIGGGIGFRPYFNCTIQIWSHVFGHPSKVHVFIDGEFYDTLYPFWPGGPISIRAYNLYLYEKGFHRLTFVANDNSSCLDIDVQIGVRGFVQHILPYLLNKM